MNRKRLALLLLSGAMVLTAYFGVCYVDRKVFATRAIEEGVAAFNNQDWATAEARYTSAIRKLPESDDTESRALLGSVYYQRAIARVEMKNYEGAFADCAQAIRLRPAYSDAFFLRGTTKMELGDFAAGDADMELCIATHRNGYPQGAHYLGLSAEMQGRFDLAAKHFQTAIKMETREDASTSKKYAALSRVLAKTGDKVGSEAAAKRARELFENVSFEFEW